MSKQVFLTNVNVTALSAERYAALSAGTQSDAGETGYVPDQAAEGDVVVHMPSTGTCNNLILNTHSGGTPGAGATITMTIRKNMVDTAVTATLGESDTTANSSSNSFTFAAGDIITIGITYTGSPTVQPVSVTLEIDYDSDISIITGGFRSTASTIYAPLGFYGSYNETIYAANFDQSSAPFAFTITAAYVYCTTAPGAAASGKERGIIISRDATPLDTFRVFEDNNEYSETGLSISIAQGDNLGAEVSIVAGADASRIRYTLVIENQTAGYNWLSAGYGGSWATAKTGALGTGTDTTTEYLYYAGPSGFQALDLYNDSDTIGASASRTATVRKNGSDSVLTATHATGLTRSSDLANTVDFAEGDTITVGIATPGDTEEGVITLNLNLPAGAKGGMLTLGAG